MESNFEWSANATQFTKIAGPISTWQDGDRHRTQRISFASKRSRIGRLNDPTFNERAA
jgi:hypothetical protein